MSIKSRFLDYEATKKLQELAKEPLDLTAKDNLTPGRIHEMVASDCGWKFLYGTQRVTDQVMEALWELAKESNALAKMEAMQSGEVINKIEGYESDNRSVLHTAMRDLFDQAQSEEAAKEAAEKARAENDKLQQFLKKIESRGFTDCIVIAIGGSQLGPESVYRALRYKEIPGRFVHYIANIDPDNSSDVINSVDLKKTFVLVVSKSGTTLETAANEAFIRQAYTERGLDPKEHIVTVSCPGTPLDDPSKYLECFHLWDYVGGRFSTTSMCGAVTLAWACGYETYLEFLSGCHAMDLCALKPNLDENLPLLMALIGIWNRNFLKLSDVVCVPYSYALSRFPAHVQQVDMESNGKHIDRFGNQVGFETGPFIWGEPGTNAQHSFYQLIHQGTDPVPLELIGFEKPQRDDDQVILGTTNHEKLFANLCAQAIALAAGHSHENPNKVFPGNRPSSLLVAKQLTPFAMGSLFVLYEHRVAFQGFIWDINSFDQEGVQLGKVLANKILQNRAAKRDDTVESVDFPLGEAVYKRMKAEG